MTTLNSKLQLALINRKKSKNLLQKGFTLVELMIVIVIVGVLSAVALPQFLGVRDRAETGANIGGMVGIAKECATGMLLGEGLLATDDRAEAYALSADCDGNTALVTLTVGTAGEAVPAGIDCANEPTGTADITVSIDTSEICTITVTDEGRISGAWSGSTT